MGMNPMHPSNFVWACSCARQIFFFALTAIFFS